jgi:hypothetical protein
MINCLLEGGKLIIMKNNKNNFLMIAIIALIVGGVGFFGGMQYQKSRIGNFGKDQFQRTQNNQNGKQRGQGNGQKMQPVSGEITSQDDKSLTIKTQDGSSKIIILSETTKVNKTSEGVKSDLKTGEQVMVIGISNSDGTLTAQTVSVGNNFFSTPNGINQSGQNSQPVAN